MSSVPGTESIQWTKSTYSTGDGGQRVQWAPNHARATGEVLVRDSKDPDGPHLTLTAAQWNGLVAFAKSHG